MLIRLVVAFLLFDLSEGFTVSIYPKPIRLSSNLPRLHYFRHQLASSKQTTPRIGLLRMNSDQSSGSGSQDSVTETKKSLDTRQDAVSDATNTSDTRRFLIAGALSLIVSIPLTFLIEFLGNEREPGPPEIQVLSDVDEKFLSKRGVRQWDIWESSSMPSNKFDYTFEKTESVYILEGEAIVTPKDGRKAVVLKPNVFASFPKGLSCVWDVKTPVRKFYKEYNSILSFE
jgi:uncharacterized protein